MCRLKHDRFRDHYAVNTAETKADSIFVSWITLPDGIMSYETSHIRNLFQACSYFDEVNTWKLLDIMQCRDVENSDGLPWDVFGSIGRKGESAEIIGKHLAATFTAFDGVDSYIDGGSDNGRCRGQQQYMFGGVASNMQRLPLLHYLSDDNTVFVFEEICDYCDEDYRMAKDETLIGFFGTAERGRQLLQEKRG